MPAEAAGRVVVPVPGRMRRLRSRLAVVRTACALQLALVFAGCADSETPLARGDRMWADSNFTGALAEYRLSYARSGSTDALARVAHGFAVTGQFQQAKEHYGELLKKAPKYTDQAVFDYLDLARQAETRSDRYGMAGAIEAAVALRPGLPVERMSATLARYYAGTGSADQAAEYFERALTEASPDSVPLLMYELAQVQQARGHCGEAVRLYEEFQARRPQDARVADADRAIGACSWQDAQAARAKGEAEKALSLLDRVTGLGSPANVQDEAWLARAEILLEQGRQPEALEAFTRALELARNPRGPVAERARQGIEQLRFGRD